MAKGETKLKVIAVIPARYKSSRFPGKPLANILGKPMISWVYSQCLKVEKLDEIYVATDDERIKECCESYKIPVIMTSPNHATGSDRVGEVASKVAGDLFINVQGDEPLIDPAEITELIEVFEDKQVYFASLRKKITDVDEIKASSTVKVVCDKDEYAMFFSRNVIPSNLKGNFKCDVFRHVGIYAYKKEFLLEFVKLKRTDLELGEEIEPLRAMENGYKIKVKETNYDSIGVDYPEQIVQVEEKLKEINNGGK